MNKELVGKLVAIVGADWVDENPERVQTYSREHANRSYSLVVPEPVAGSLVVKPATTEEIAAVLKLCNAERVPVIAKGGGTALAANAIPTEPSLILSLERLNRIEEIDEENLVVTCQAAVTLGDLVEAMQKHPRLYFPLHPGDEGAQIGGMVAMNAGGVRAVRHGVMRDQIRGLEAVLPTGEVIQCGGSLNKLIKDNAGYSLMHLLIGSEGTLGVITKAVLKLYPRPQVTAVLIIPFQARKGAFQCVAPMLAAGLIPMAVEYVERDHIMATARDLGKDWPTCLGVGDLLVFMAEEKEDDLYAKAMAIEKICRQFGAMEVLVAATREEQRRVLAIRSHVLPAIEKDIVDSPDITVPRSKLNDIIAAIEELEKTYKTRIPLLAHAGDGNLHTYIVKEEGKAPSYYQELAKALYQKTIELGGTITGEHGVGMLRLQYLPLQFSPRELDIMWRIKKAFDPHNILNPGKKVSPYG